MAACCPYHSLRKALRFSTKYASSHGQRDCLHKAGQGANERIALASDSSTTVVAWTSTIAFAAPPRDDIKIWYTIGILHGPSQTCQSWMRDRRPLSQRRPRFHLRIF